MSSEAEVGFAVVGLGMGRHHVRCMKSLPGVKLIGVCDIREDRREEASQAASCKAWATLDEALDDPEVEVIDICSPSGRHSEMAIRAAEAGKHVLCEKPLDVTLPAIDAMIEACQKAGVRLGGIFQRRTSGLYNAVRDALDAGRLGRVALVDVSVRWYRAQSYYDSDGGWRGTWEWDGGGSLMNQGVHSVDILQWLGGPVRSVSARTAIVGHQIETEDVTVSAVEFVSGALGTITSTTCAYPGLYEDVNVHGMEGSIRVVDGKLSTWKVKQGTLGTPHEEEQEMLRRYGSQATGSGSADPMAVGLEGHAALIADMASAVREGREPLVPGREGRKAVEIITAVYQSAREGIPIILGANQSG